MKLDLVVMMILCNEICFSLLPVISVLHPIQANFRKRGAAYTSVTDLSQGNTVRQLYTLSLNLE